MLYEMKKAILSLILYSLTVWSGQAQLLTEVATNFPVKGTAILTDIADSGLVSKSAQLLQLDIERVTGYKPEIIHRPDKSFRNIIAIGSISHSGLLKELSAKKKLSLTSLANKWEGYQVQHIPHPLPGIDHILTIAGSDRRGTAYGVFEFSKQLGVSPWYWWADVPVTGKRKLFITPGAFIADAPKVKYRGIFINDEAPCLSNWSKEKFGGFNHLFYQKVFELMLRLKANYVWPAMWGNAFYDDDSLNIKSADEYGIVIGTSHHEPLMRAHDEWRRYGKGKWNYDSNEVRLNHFWKTGMQRAWNEKIVSVGMRGDGDEPMSRETATSLLERIVNDQRKIITSVTGKPAEETPQLWALYKEVQDYYDKGMRVPDDITLLLCDDNWGNLRKLPSINEKPRKGGYGIYYHFDYVGGPRNYKWINTNNLPRIWEQMHLAWEYKAREIWIVNVGDIKPMELPISFFLDYAWNPEQIGADQLQQYTEIWARQQFGKTFSKEIAGILSTQAKFTSRRKPELLNEKTFSLAHYEEFNTVVSEYNELSNRAEKIYNQLPGNFRDAYFQLVLQPVKASATLYNLYYQVALNQFYYGKKHAWTNEAARKVRQHYTEDSLLTQQYHQLNSGKWNHMMSQTHIGYTYWQQPPFNKMPMVSTLPADSIQITDKQAIDSLIDAIGNLGKSIKIVKDTIAWLPGVFYEKDRTISIHAVHFTKNMNTGNLRWKILPDHGRTGDAITTFPVTAAEQKPGGLSPHLSYSIFTNSTGEFTMNSYFSPTLNFQNTPNGLQFAISVDDELPQIISINSEDKTTGSGIWNKWVSENIIIKKTTHAISQPGLHTVKYWMVSSGVVLQQLVLDFGGLKESYLGPPETLFNPLKH